MEMYSLKPGERLLVLRHRALLSKTELAKRIGVSPSTITNYERGKNLPNKEIMERLSDVFGASINFIMFGFDDSVKDNPREPLIK